MIDPVISSIVAQMEQMEWEALERITDPAEWSRRFYELIDANNGYSHHQRWDGDAYEQWMALPNRNELAPCDDAFFD